MKEWLILEAKQIPNSIHKKSDLFIKLEEISKFLNETRHFIL